MNKCIDIGNIAWNISKFLPIKDILQYSNSNKSLHDHLDPTKNVIINTLYMQNVQKKFFDYKINKNLLDSFINSQYDWKLLFIQLTEHFKRHEDSKFSNKILECFQTHLYLPDIRKNNKYLEHDMSSLHMTTCYDMHTRNNCIYNYFNKQITLDYMTKGKTDNNMPKIKVLKEGNFFQEELQDFSQTFYQIIKEENYTNCIDNLVCYNFKALEDDYKTKYTVNKNEKKNYGMNIIYTILWINYCFILYTDLIQEYLNGLDPEIEPKCYVDEYNKMYNNINNSALLLNSNLENLTIIINYFEYYYRNSSLVCKNCINKSYFEKFSFYKLFHLIIEKNIFEKSFDKLLYKTSFLIKDLSCDMFDKSDKMNISVDEYDELMNKDDFDDNELLDIDEDEDELEEKTTTKESLQNIMTDFTDMTINEKNANAINHTELKTDEKYTKYENFIIDNFTNALNEKIKEEKSISLLFESVSKIVKCNPNSKKLIIKNDSINVIRRTKMRLMVKLIHALFQYGLCLLQKDFSNYFLNALKNTEELMNEEMVKNIEFQYDLEGLENNTKMTVTEKIDNGINYVSKSLIDLNIVQFESEEIKKAKISLVNKFMSNLEMENVKLIKDIICFYYKELGIYKDKNEQVEYLLKGGKCKEEKDEKLFLFDKKNVFQIDEFI